MEFPLIEKKWNKNNHSMDIVYPNKYYGGVYCLGPLIVYNIVNSMENWNCNRVFLDKGSISSKLIGFTLQYELDYYNVLKMLKNAGIPADKSMRKEIVFAGGPCISTNPYTLSDYFDFAMLGDVEETLPQVLRIFESSKSKEDFLKNIADIKGVFVYGITSNPDYARVTDFNNAPYPLYQPFEQELDGNFVFGKTFMLEVERGCIFKCRFCSLPQLSNTTGFRSMEKIKEIIDTGLELNNRNHVSIYAPSFIHPERNKIMKYLLEKKVTFTVPAIKIERIDYEFLSLVKAGGTRSITLAPECNEELRSSVGKYYSDEKLFEIVKMAEDIGFEGIKYYFLIGLPQQTDNDIEKMATLALSLKSKFKGKTYFSINPLVAKSRTSFEGIQFDRKIINHQAKLLTSLMKKNKVKIKPINVSTSFTEWKLSNALSFSKPRADHLHNDA